MNTKQVAVTTGVLGACLGMSGLTFNALRKDSNYAMELAKTAHAINDSAYLLSTDGYPDLKQVRRAFEEKNDKLEVVGTLPAKLFQLNASETVQAQLKNAGFAENTSQIVFMVQKR